MSSIVTRLIDRAPRSLLVAGITALLGVSVVPSVAGAIDGPILPAPAVRTPHEQAITYGIAVPPEMFPEPAGLARMRKQFIASGTCWLRSDVDADLVRAIERLPWLGSRRKCEDGHLRVLAILDHQTLDAAGAICPRTRFSRAGGLAATFTLQDWGKLVGCVAKRLKGRVAAYEIWNEPLVDDFKTGYQDGSVGHYYDLLKVASKRIRNVDADAKIVALGGVDVYASGPDARRVPAAERFSQRLAAKGAARFADAVSVHAYPWGEYEDTVRLDAFRRGVLFHAQTWGRPVWVTETGHRADEAGSQSRFLIDAYNAMLGAGAERIVWFALRDAADGKFGIVRRPVHATMAEFIEVPKSGLLRVFSHPAVRSLITVTALDVNPTQSFVREWGLDWERVQEGRYQVVFSEPGLLGEVPGLFPGPQTVTVLPGQVTIVAVDPADGSVSVSACWEGRDCPHATSRRR